jgi:hypothetical protein
VKRLWGFRRGLCRIGKWKCSGAGIVPRSGHAANGIVEWPNGRNDRKGVIFMGCKKGKGYGKGGKK